MSEKVKYLSPKTNAMKTFDPTKPKKKGNFQEGAEILKKSKLSKVHFDGEEMYVENAYYRLGFDAPCGIVGTVCPKELEKVAKLVGLSAFSAVENEGQLYLNWDGSTAALGITKALATMDILGGEQPPIRIDEELIMETFLGLMVSGGMGLNSKISHFDNRFDFLHWQQGQFFRSSDGQVATEVCHIGGAGTICPQNDLKFHQSGYDMLRLIDRPLQEIRIYSSDFVELRFEGCTLVFKTNPPNVKNLTKFETVKARGRSGYRVKVNKDFWRAVKKFPKGSKILISNGLIECDDFSLNTDLHIFLDFDSKKKFAIDRDNLLRAKKFASNQAEFEFYTELDATGSKYMSYLFVNDLDDDLMIIAGRKTYPDSEENPNV